jgi:glycerol-3-phosphate acyltransferase PlsX
MPKLAIDAMTSEAGVDSIARGAWIAWQADQGLTFLVVGDTALTQPAFDAYFSGQTCIEYAHASDVITHADDPVVVMRRKKNSSTHVSLQAVAHNKADGVVSCANTGALVALSRYYLKRLPGIERIAFAGSFPTYQDKDVFISDIGANVDAEPEHLYQYAKMLAAYLRSEDNPRPRIGLLSNGVEAIKGNDVVRKTDSLLRQDGGMQYEGYVEGNGIFSGQLDAVICDGFVGNAVLKSCEESARFIRSVIKKVLQESWLGLCIAGPLMWLLNKYAVKLKPAKRNGALMLGLRGVVVKSHGCSEAESFATAIGICAKAVRSGMIASLQSHFKDLEVDAASVE